MDCRDKLPGQILPTPLFPDGRGELIDILLPGLECEIKSYFLPEDLDLRGIKLNKNPIECLKPQKSKPRGDASQPPEPQPYIPGQTPGTHTKDDWISLVAGQPLSVIAEFGAFNEFIAERVVNPESAIGIDWVLSTRVSPPYTQFGGLVSQTINFQQAVNLWGGGDVSFGIGRFAGASSIPFVQEGDRLLVRQTFITSDAAADAYRLRNFGAQIYSHLVDVYFIRQGDSPDWFDKVYYNRYEPPLRTFNNASLGSSSYMFGFSLGSLNNYQLSWTIKPRSGITLNEFQFVPVSPPRTLRVNGVDILPLTSLTSNQPIFISGDNGMKEDCCDCIEAMAALMEAYMEKIEKLIAESEDRIKEHINDTAHRQCLFFQEQLKAFEITDDDRILRRLGELENNLWTGGNLKQITEEK